MLEPDSARPYRHLGKFSYGESYHYAGYVLGCFFMPRETYKKRQKELARQQKQRDKVARRQQRRSEKKKELPPLEGEVAVSGELRLELRAQDYGAWLCP